MDPFSVMSQDDFKKIEEVLQSEQGRAILHETTSQVVRPGVSGLINSPMESLGLSDSDLVDNLTLDPSSTSNFFAVPNDEEVANIASDFLHNSTVKVLEVNPVLMDHCYSLPAETERFGILTDGKTDCGTGLVTDGDNESTDSANSPISAHGSVSGSVKTEDEGLMESVCPGRDAQYEKMLVGSQIKPENCMLSVGGIDSRLDKLAGVNAPSAGLQERTEIRNKLLRDVLPVPTLPQTRGRTRALRHSKAVTVSEESGVTKVPRESRNTNGNIISDTGSQPNSFSSSPREKRARNTNTERQSVSSDIEAEIPIFSGKVGTTSQREVPISGKLLSEHGFGIITKSETKRSARNADKPVSKMEEGTFENRAASLVKNNSEKRIRKPSVRSEDQESKNSFTNAGGRRKSIDQLKKEVPEGSLSKKKSLSVSECKSDAKPVAAPEAKRRRLSSGSEAVGPNTSSTASTILKTKIVRPKKKVSRTDSISADLLGPALFSEPDMMVKVKDSADDKMEKGTGSAKASPAESDANGSDERKETIPKSLSELDMIKAEVCQEDESRDKSVSPEAHQLETASNDMKPDAKKLLNRCESKESIMTVAQERKPEQNVTVNDENETVAKSEPKSTVPKASSISGYEDASTSQRPLRERQISAAVIGSKHESVDVSTAEKPCAPNLAVRTRRSSVKSNQQAVSSPSEEDNMKIVQSSPMIKEVESGEEGGRSAPSSVADKSKKPVEAVRPERKSQRVHKKRKLFEDEESPERLRKERKPNTVKNAETPKKAQKNTKKGFDAKSKRHAPDEDDEPVDEGDFADDPEDSDWDSEDDPEKLWCICRQPHNNKFMIQCDKCNDWFHGTCVSVTRQLGRQLEKEKRDWICPICSKGSVAKSARESQGSTPKEAKAIEKTARRQVRAVPKKEASIAMPQQQDARSRPQPTVLPSTRRNEAANKLTAADVKGSQNSSTKEIKSGTKQQNSAVAEDRGIKSEAPAKEMKSAERVTRNTIPKNYILKSRDPVKRESVSAEKETLKTPVATVKNEPPKREEQKAEAKVSKMVTRTGKPVIKGETLKSESCLTNAGKQKVGNAKEVQKLHAQKEEHKNNVPKETTKSTAQREMTKTNAQKDLVKPNAQKTSMPKSFEQDLASVEAKSGRERNSVSTRKSSQSSVKDKRSTVVEKSLGGSTSKNSNKDSNKSNTPKPLKSEIPKKKMEISLKERKPAPNKKKYDCIVCSKPAPPGTIYCTSTCLEKYAAESVKIINTTLKSNEDTDSKKVVVIDRQTGNLSTGVNAPVLSELVSWLKANPSCEVVRPNSDPSTPKKEQQQLPPKERDLFERDESEDSAIRVNVRRTMRAILMDRCKNSDDLKVSEEEIMKMAVKIEDELHKCFKDNSSKYRNKYRSLMFNIKDPRNQGLFRKILKGKIPPDKLVRMSPEELASKELAKWREKENQHSLDMIKRMQMEQQQSSGLRKKTHKGEIEIEEEVPVVGFELLVEDSAKTPPRPVEETIEVTPEKKEEKKEEKETEKDTTGSHRSHLFDLNCKICTGKIAPPPPEEPTPKKVRVAHSISVEHSSPKLTDLDKSFSASLDAQALISEASSDSMDKDLSSNRSPDSNFNSRKQDNNRQPSSVWKGFVYMQDITKFVTCAYRVSGPTEFLSQDIPDTVQICGRIAPEQVYDYLSKIKQSGNKELTIIRFKAANDEEAGTYNEFYQYLSTRKRYGVVSSSSKHVKDFYIVPLAAQSPVPSVLMPFNGPGLPSKRPHLLLGVLVRHRSRQASAQSKVGASKEDDITSTPPTSSTVEEGSYTPPIESGPYTPHNEEDTYSPPLEDQSYTPPLDDPSYTPPLEDRSYTPPSEDHSATLPTDDSSAGGSPPYEGGSYTPPFNERDSYTPPLGDVSYTPPLEDGSYTPPLPYRSTSKKTSQYVPLSISSSTLKRVHGEDDAYEPSYTPPLDQFPRNCEDDDGNLQPYDPEQMDQMSDGGNHMKRVKNLIFPNRAGNTSSHSESSPADIERQKRILNELTQKVQETDRQVCQSMNVLKQLGADVPDMESQHLAAGKEAGFGGNGAGASASLSGMSSFLNNLPQNLRDIFSSSVGQSATSSGKVSIDSRISSDFPGPINEFDVDERSSSQGGTPPPCDDDGGHGSSELRPSDPRIKLRTSFHDDQYAAELAQKSLSSMSTSELVKRAEKELADIEPSVKVLDGSVGDEYSTQSWQSHQEPPPPGVEPPDMLSADSSAFACMSDSSSTSQSSSVYPSTQLPEGHVLAPPFVPPSPSAIAAPAIAPPSVFPTHLPPPGYPLHSPSVNAQAPALPPAFMAPPPPVPPPLPPDVLDQREKGYLSWPPDSSTQELGSQPRNWEKHDWGDWDHRPTFERDRMPPPPPEFYPGSESQDDWYRDQRRRDFFPDEHSRDGSARWSEEDWEHHRFERNRPQRFGSRYRGQRRDEHWRGNNNRRRVFPRSQRD